MAEYWHIGATAMRLRAVTERMVMGWKRRGVDIGAAILLMFTWRRLTSAAVWTAVIGSAGINIVFPLVAQHVPALRNHPALVARTGETAGRPLPVYFESVIRSDATDANSPLQGRGRLHTELVILRGFGMDIVNASPGGRLAGRFFVDAMLPLVLLLAVSLATRPPEAERVRQFFGKMKTPVAATPEEDQRAMEETRQRPERFDDRKLFQGTAWEFTRWDKVDAIGFAVSCAVTVAIIGAFLGLLGLIRS